MTTPAKLYGKDLGEYDEMDVDELLAKLSAEEINILAKEVDPDVSSHALKIGYVLIIVFHCKCRIVFYLHHKDAIMNVKKIQRVH